MSDLAVRLEDISDDEQPSTDAPTDTDPLAISGGAAYSNLGKEIITLNTDMPCSTSVENNSEQSWKSIEMSPCPILPYDLPEGWVAIHHASGATVYLHRESRVCTWSRPYIIKKGTSVKNNLVPVWAIPCLQEWLFKDPEAEHVTRWKAEEQKKLPLARLKPELVEEYLSHRWKMKIVTPLDNDQRDASIPPPSKKQKKDTCLPAALSQTVTVQIPEHFRKCAHQKGYKNVPTEWSVNTASKTAVQILNEFLQLCPIGTVEYNTNECWDINEPYLCTILINKISYGQAGSANKRQAKQLAAERTLNMLLPNTFTTFLKKEASTDDYQYFNGVSIEDPKLVTMCAEAGLPLPYQILTECVQRHQGIMPSTEIEFSVKTNESNSLEYCMSLGGSHLVTGSCASKKEGKQLAAQALLQELHPFVNNWATIMHMYTNTWKHFEVAVDYESSKSQEGSNYEPNYAMLKKLHDEMRNLSQEPSTEVASDFRMRHLLLRKGPVLTKS
ncbi:microprocessor complex subunit DGCR8-like [Dysidea avara]|uniref:microprocessor complex subunit DGCR8-like n=1 Tax=Dysidea avara TaxID=196820 RepID=UPI00331D9F11